MLRDKSQRGPFQCDPYLSLESMFGSKWGVANIQCATDDYPCISLIEEFHPTLKDFPPLDCNPTKLCLPMSSFDSKTQSYKYISYVYIGISLYEVPK